VVRKAATNKLASIPFRNLYPRTVRLYTFICPMPIYRLNQGLEIYGLNGTVFSPILDILHWTTRWYQRVQTEGMFEKHAHSDFIGHIHVGELTLMLAISGNHMWGPSGCMAGVWAHLPHRLNNIDLKVVFSNVRTYLHNFLRSHISMIARLSGTFSRKDFRQSGLLILSAISSNA